MRRLMLTLFVILWPVFASAELEIFTCEPECAALADEIVLTLLGPSWIAVVAPFRVLALAALLHAAAFSRSAVHGGVSGRHVADHHGVEGARDFDVVGAIGDGRRIAGFDNLTVVQHEYTRHPKTVSGKPADESTCRAAISLPSA